MHDLIIRMSLTFLMEGVKEEVVGAREVSPTKQYSALDSDCLSKL